jgi:simple sugar transport system permease protein
VTQSATDVKIPPARGSAQPPGEADATVRGTAGRLAARVIRAPEFGAAAAAIVLYAFFAIQTAGNGFTTIDGTANWLSTASQLGIIAVPIGLLMIAGEFDLSIGSMVGAASITMGIVCGFYGEPLLVGIAVAMAIAIVTGIVNGLLVTHTTIPSFIVTLATNLILVGLGLAISRSLTETTQVSFTPEGAVADVLGGQVGKFDTSILWWLAILVIAAWVLTKHRFGNWILATGGHSENARRAGVPTVRVKLALFVCSAVAAALVGVIQAIQFDGGDAVTGQGYVFQAPIVVVIGGVLLAGGYGTIVGVVLGTLIYGFVNAGLFYTGWDTDYLSVIIGVLMVITVLMNNFVRHVALRTVGLGGRR